MKLLQKLLPVTLLTAADADKASRDYIVITRDDLKKQWPTEVKPLYFWTVDCNPDDKTGDNFMSVWHVPKH